MIGSLGELDPIRKFASIQAPTLVVHSELDPIPAEWSRFLAATIPNADFALIEGGSHFPMVENAEQLRTTVLPWLASMPEGRSNRMATMANDRNSPGRNRGDLSLPRSSHTRQATETVRRWTS